MTPSFNPFRTKVRTPVPSDTLRTRLSTIFPDRFSDAPSVGPIERIKLASVVDKRRGIFAGADFEGDSSSSFFGPGEFTSFFVRKFYDVLEFTASFGLRIEKKPK